MAISEAYDVFREHVITTEITTSGYVGLSQCVWNFSSKVWSTNSTLSILRLLLSLQTLGSYLQPLGALQNLGANFQNSGDPTKGGGGVRVKIPLLMVKGKNSCVQAFLHFIC